MKKVFVALSGGVDSAVTAHILKSEGWNVTGVFIRAWQPNFLPCNQDEEERAALRVAAHLGIPFKHLDLSSEYKKEVVDVMVSEYKKGRTPNPDVLCNATIKFGAFLQYAIKSGADKIATGHHAQIKHFSTSGTKMECNLVRGVDKEKDQAYFLWKLTQEQLSKTLMPIGYMQKSEVREYAKKYNIPSALKPDSQGLCFLGHVDMKTFLMNFITTETGDVLNEEGEIIGTHDGSELVTIGQRGGFTIHTKDENREALYVISKDINKNIVIVAPKNRIGIHFCTSTKMDSNPVLLIDTNWSQTLEEGKKYTAEIRYHGVPHSCIVQNIQKETVEITFDIPLLIASGQSVVLYNKNICLGGGVVE